MRRLTSGSAGRGGESNGLLSGGCSQVESAELRLRMRVAPLGVRVGVTEAGEEGLRGEKGMTYHSLF